MVLPIEQQALARSLFGAGHSNGERILALDDPRCFLEIYGAKGIRKAADRLNIASSILSRRIGALEKSLGVKLFDRHAGGVAPTPAGEIYARYARGTLLDEERLKSDLVELGGLKKGHVRVHTPEGYALDFVTNAMVQFRRKHPGITFDVFTGSSERILTAVQEGRADIGLAFTPGHIAGIESAMSIHAPLLAVMSPSHPLARKPRLDLAEVISCPLALPNDSYGIRRLVDTMCTVERLKPHPVLTTNSVAAMKGFARRRGGVTLLPKVAIDHEVATGVLVGVPLRNRTFNRTTIEVCVLARRRLPLAVSKFLRDLKKHGERSE